MTKTILVLSAGNSARSIMAEAYINHMSQGRWTAYSAGPKPNGGVNPLALEALAAAGIPPPHHPRSKSWDEFTGPNAPKLDLVVTVCDNAAQEVCPYFPGTAQKVHLPFPDPAAASGSHAEQLQSFKDVLAAMRPQLAAVLISAA